MSHTFNKNSQQGDVLYIMYTSHIPFVMLKLHHYHPPLTPTQCQHCILLLSVSMLLLSVSMLLDWFCLFDEFVCLIVCLMSLFVCLLQPLCADAGLV